MRRLTLLISVALALVAVAIPATASAKRHHSRHHARLADRNHNGIPDSWERRFRVHKASADPDRDGVTNLGEFNDGTNPRNPDTNGNGIPDGQDDANDDGVADGQEQAGTVTSFDGTTLVITLVSGSTEQGTVNGDTEIECEDSALTTTAATRDDGGDSNSGDSQSGEDNQTSTTPTPTSGDTEDQGDDDQGDNNDDNSTCGTAALQPGTIVKEAELKLTSAGAVFDSIHLGGKAPA
jgi:hypothetical protein